MTEEICCFERCKRPSAIIYYRKPLCDNCWNKLSTLPTNEMKDLLRVRRKKDKPEAGVPLSQEPDEEQTELPLQEFAVDKT